MAANNFNTNDLFTGTGTNDLGLTRVNRRGMTPAAIFWTVFGSLVGAAIVGTGLAVILTLFYAKKRGGSLSKGPYGVCNASSLNVVVSTFGSTTGVANPTIGTVLNVACPPASALTTDVGPVVTLPDITANPVKYETVPGIYIVKIQNNATSNQDLDTVHIAPYFVGDNDFLATTQVSLVLDEIEAEQPIAAIISVWGDATKILTDKVVLEKLTKLGATEISTSAPYTTGSPYFLVHQRYGDSTEYLGAVNGHYYNQTVINIAAPSS